MVNRVCRAEYSYIIVTVSQYELAATNSRGTVVCGDLQTFLVVGRDMWRCVKLLWARLGDSYVVAILAAIPPVAHMIPFMTNTNR